MANRSRTNQSSAPAKTYRDPLNAPLRQQQSIAALSRAAVKRDDLAALINDAVKHIAEELEVNHVQISELLPKDSSFAFGAGRGWLLEAMGAGELALALEPQSAFTIAVGEPVISPDLSAERRFMVPNALLKNGAASSMSVVIRAQPEAFGVFTIYSK